MDRVSASWAFLASLAARWPESAVAAEQRQAPAYAVCSIKRAEVVRATDAYWASAENAGTLLTLTGRSEHRAFRAQFVGFTLLSISAFHQFLVVLCFRVLCFNFYNAVLESVIQQCEWVSEWKSLSRVWLFATPRTVQSMEFSRPEYWSGEPFPSPWDLPNPDIELRSPVLQVNSLPAELSGKPRTMWTTQNYTYIPSSWTSLRPHPARLPSSQPGLLCCAQLLTSCPSHPGGVCILMLLPPFVPPLLPPLCPQVHSPGLRLHSFLENRFIRTIFLDSIHIYINMLCLFFLFWFTSLCITGCQLLKYVS